MYLRGKYPYKHNSDINQMIQQKGKNYLNQEEASDIVRYMYNQEDTQTILDKLYQNYKSLTQNIDINKLPREEQIALMKVEKESQKQIEYKKFEKIILDFQLKSHHNFLSNFLNLFRKVDQDQNGVIDEDEFIQLIQFLEIDEQSKQLL